VLDVFEGDAAGVGWSRHKPLELDALRAALKQAVSDPAHPVAFVIAKATQGKDFADPAFPAWARVCRDLGVAFGAYHFASNTEDGTKQAAWFLQHVDAAACDPATTALALDAERHGVYTVTLEQERAFAIEIERRRLFWPLLYGDESFIGSRVVDPDDVLVNCPPWIAVYGGSGPRVPKGYRLAGKTWKLWQYTDGKYTASVGPRESLPFHRMDRNAYAGTIDALHAEWPSLGG
jgi:lysozyme